MSGGKRPSLAESMRQVASASPPPSNPPPVLPTVSHEPSPHAKIGEGEGRPARFYAATRAGKKKVTAALDPPAHKQLKALAVEREMTTEALLSEAINDLFRKHGKSPIA